MLTLIFVHIHIIINNNKVLKKVKKMLCGNRCQQRYAVGKIIGDNTNECASAHGIFDPEDTVIKSFEVRFVHNQLSLELFNLVNRNQI
jgi:hypothetical protein